MSDAAPQAALNAIRAAEAEAGYSDPTASEFLPQLTAWVAACQATALTEAGRISVEEMTHRWLLNRLRLARDLAAHPEIRDEDVSDPIVVVGFPRSGTTVLQRMLSADPAVQSLKLWKVLNPAPFADEQPENPEGRFAFAKQVADTTKTGNPLLFSAHPQFADDAEEDWFLHHLTFRHALNLCCGPFNREYLEYLRGQPRQPTYTYAGDLLRYLQWQDGGRRGRPWIMKSPAHIGYIEEILKVHPKATFVYPRRDFATVMASFCYTLEMSLTGVYPIDPRELGALSMDLWLHEMERFYDARRRLGDRLKLMEIPYLELLSDPIPHIGRIHRQAGRELDERGESAIEAWISNNPPNKHGKNVYSLDRYGLEKSTVEDAFAKFD